MTPSNQLINDLMNEAECWVDYAFSSKDPRISAPISELVDSPIEASLLAAIVFYMRMWGETVVVTARGGEDKDLWLRPEVADPFTTVIIPQFSVGKYRADFLIYNLKSKKPRLIVECDGHDFHEKTKDQAQRDKERDRFLTKEGYHVIRFTGSEIYRSPVKCATEVHQILLEIFRMELEDCR